MKFEKLVLYLFYVSVIAVAVIAVTRITMHEPRQNVHAEGVPPGSELMPCVYFDPGKPPPPPTAFIVMHLDVTDWMTKDRSHDRKIELFQPSDQNTTTSDLGWKGQSQPASQAPPPDPKSSGYHTNLDLDLENTYLQATPTSPRIPVFSKAGDSVVVEVVLDDADPTKKDNPINFFIPADDKNQNSSLFAVRRAKGDISTDLDYSQMFCNLDPIIETDNGKNAAIFRVVDIGGFGVAGINIGVKIGDGKHPGINMPVYFDPHIKN